MTTPSQAGSPAVRPKEFHFPASVEWVGERRVVAGVEGKPAIAVMPPPVFRGTDPATWSPEDLLVAAVASCLAVTFTGLAARGGLEYENLRVDADGVVGRRPDGRFGFTSLELWFAVSVAAGAETAARDLAAEAERTCLVSASLDVPVEAQVVVTTST